MPVLFFLIWLVLAGEMTLGTCLWGVAVSALLSWACRKFLGQRRRPWRGLGEIGACVSYLWYLLREILKAGFVVMRLIYTKGAQVEPKLICFDTTLRSDRARTVLADTITLTAGTITVTAEDGRFCVHALDASLAEGIEHCEFQRRLEKLEA